MSEFLRCTKYGYHTKKQPQMEPVGLVLMRPESPLSGFRFYPLRIVFHAAKRWQSVSYIVVSMFKTLHIIIFRILVLKSL